MMDPTEAEESNLVKQDGVNDSEDPSNIQTVYTNLTPVTIQDESGLRQIYVPVEQADTLTSLAESISGSTGNQHLPVPGIPGQLITITLPPGTSNSTGHIQIADAATLLSLQENNVISIPPTEETEQLNVQQGDETNGEEEPSLTEPVTEQKQSDKTITGSEIGSELLGSFLNSKESKGGTDSDEYIRTLLTQSQDGLTDPLTQVEANQEGNESTLSLTRKSLAPRVTLPQVFSNIEASLSSALLEAIPGSKSAYLNSIEKELSVKLHTKANDSFSFVCSENQIPYLYDKLSPLLPSARNPFRAKHQRHKGVSCDLLRPMFSRSGREVKPKQYNTPIDDEPAEPDSDFEAKPPTLLKRKRGRPPKNLKAGEEKSVKVDHHSGELIVKQLRVPETGHEDVTANSISNSAEQGEFVDQKENLIVESNVDPDASSSNDGLRVEELVEPSVLTNFPPDTLTLDDENMKALIKFDAEKSLGIKLENVSEDANMKLSDVKPVKRTRNLVGPKKPPKKDYESLLPFKYFCNQCSFKSKRQSHYARHMELHGKGLPLLRCNQCNFTTIRLSHLRRHTLFHTSELHKCKNCKYQTYDMHHLNRHMKVKHPTIRNSVAQVYECPMCDHVTSTEFQYKRHLRVHADVCGGVENPDRIVASYQCPVCDYNTKKKDHFARHIKQVHSELRPYLCDLCGKSFKRQDTLRSHKVVHMDKSIRMYPFHCNVCTKDFRTQAHLTEHLTTHSNARQYLCEICGASFKTRNVQRKHVKTIHRNPRSHKCSDCEKSFNTKFGLQRHARTHETPGMKKTKQEPSTLDPSDTLSMVPGVHDLGTVDQVPGATVQDIGAEEEHHMPTAVIPGASDLQHSHLSVPVSSTDGVLTEGQQITIPLPVDMQQQVHEVPTTIQLGDATHAVALAEGTYQQDADGSLRQVIPHLIQTGDATTLLYVPNM